MKKLLTLIVSSALAFSLMACSSQSTAEESTNAAAGNTNTAAENPSAAAETAEEVSAETEEAVTEAAAEAESSAEAETSADTNASEETAAPEETSERGALVAYFSWSGNTEQMAQIIAEETGADLFEIAPAMPYTDDYDELLDIARQEQAEEARPELAAQVEWKTGTAMIWFLWGIQTGGAMHRWQFIRSWRAVTGRGRPWFPLIPAPAAALEGVFLESRKAPPEQRSWRALILRKANCQMQRAVFPNG